MLTFKEYYYVVNSLGRITDAKLGLVKYENNKHYIIDRIELPIHKANDTIHDFTIFYKEKSDIESNLDMLKNTLCKYEDLYPFGYYIRTHELAEYIEYININDKYNDRDYIYVKETKSPFYRSGYTIYDLDVCLDMIDNINKIFNKEFIIVKYI
jgi:hypothetical protein